MTALSTDEGARQPASRWDFFLSHRSADTPVAARLKEALGPPATVFLDVDSIGDGEESLMAVREALDSSLVYVFVLWWDTKVFNYVRVELEYAIQLFRDNPNTSRIVPLYLNRDSQPPSTEVPLGLGVFKGIAVPDPQDLSAAVARLQRTLVHVKSLEARRGAIASEARAAADAVNRGGLVAVTAGVRSATSIVWPAVKTLLALDVVVLAAVVVFAFLALWLDRGLPILVVLAVIFFALLITTLGLASLALRTTAEINRRGIQGA
jgi:hypothetical protein